MRCNASIVNHEKMIVVLYFYRCFRFNIRQDYACVDFFIVIEIEDTNMAEASPRNTS